MQVANAPYSTSHSFDDFYVCDPKAKHHGFKSWDGKVLLILWYVEIFADFV